jgi:outer membrane receptor protein involved in Fe transport
MNKIPFKRTRFFAACAGVVGASMLPGHVVAQGMLEEVIVTAQKRAQNLQDVPISVQAFTGEKLAESGIKDVFDLQTNAPGLTVDQNQNATTSNFSIRGIGTGGNNFGFESAVGLYVDGVYRSRQSSMINQLVDMQSVDILRGPQGTLFGRNTLAGAIQFGTVKPDHEGTGFAEVTVGNYGLLNLSGAASISAIEDVLAFRVTGFSSERDGTFDNLTGPDGSDTINDRDRYGFRAQALWTPTDDLTVRVIADYAELDEVCCGFSILYDADRNDQRNIIGSVTLPGAPPIPTSTLGTPGIDTIVRERGGLIVPESRVFDDVQATNFDPQSSSIDQGLSVQLDYDLNDGYTLTSITSYREFESYDFIDADFSTLDALTDENDAEQDQFSQEFRLSYVGEDLNFVVGANYFEQTLESVSTLSYGEDTELLAETNLGIPIGIFGVFAPFTGFDDIFPPDGFAFDVNKQKHESWAVFGQFDYLLTETLTLTAGLRYSDEHKELDATYNESGDDPAFGLEAFAATFARDDISTELDDDQVTGTVKLSWFATDDIMLYGSYTTGYKAGGTNTDRINRAFEQNFDAETVESYEIGMKAEFPDQGLRLNIAVFQSEVDDQQVGSFNGTDFNVQNAATGETKGIEIDALWQATDTTTVNFAYSFVDATRDEFEKGNCHDASPFRLGIADSRALVEDADGSFRPAATQDEAFAASVCDNSGEQLAVNPESKAILGVRQEFSLSDSTLAYGLFEYSYVDEMQLLPSGDPLGVQDAYKTINLRLGLLLEDYQTEITLWGRNVTDEDWVGIAFGAPLQAGRIGAYGREPRTYGLTINKKF